MEQEAAQTQGQNNTTQQADSAQEKSTLGAQAGTNINQVQDPKSPEFWNEILKTDCDKFMTDSELSMGNFDKSENFDSMLEQGLKSDFLDGKVATNANTLDMMILKSVCSESSAISADRLKEVVSSVFVIPKNATQKALYKLAKDSSSRIIRSQGQIFYTPLLQEWELFCMKQKFSPEEFEQNLGPEYKTGYKIIRRDKTGQQGYSHSLPTEIENNYPKSDQIEQEIITNGSFGHYIDYIDLPTINQVIDNNEANDDEQMVPEDNENEIDALNADFLNQYAENDDETTGLKANSMISLNQRYFFFIPQLVYSLRYTYIILYAIISNRLSLKLPWGNTFPPLIYIYKLIFCVDPGNELKLLRTSFESMTIKNSNTKMTAMLDKICVQSQLDGFLNLNNEMYQVCQAFCASDVIQRADSDEFKSVDTVISKLMMVYRKTLVLKKKQSEIHVKMCSQKEKIVSMRTALESNISSGDPDIAKKLSTYSQILNEIVAKGVLIGDKWLEKYAIERFQGIKELKDVETNAWFYFKSLKHLRLCRFFETCDDKKYKNGFMAHMYADYRKYGNFSRYFFVGAFLRNELGEEMFGDTDVNIIKYFKQMDAVYSDHAIGSTVTSILAYEADAEYYKQKSSIQVIEQVGGSSMRYTKVVDGSKLNMEAGIKRSGFSSANVPGEENYDAKMEKEGDMNAEFDTREKNEEQENVHGASYSSQNMMDFLGNAVNKVSNTVFGGFGKPK